MSEDKVFLQEDVDGQLVIEKCEHDTDSLYLITKIEMSPRDLSKALIKSLKSLDDDGFFYLLEDILVGDKRSAHILKEDSLDLVTDIIGPTPFLKYYGYEIIKYFKLTRRDWEKFVNFILKKNVATFTKDDAKEVISYWDEDEDQGPSFYPFKKDKK